MNISEANELIKHVNGSGGGRFAAGLLDIGPKRAWVLVADRHDPSRDGNPHVLEPIADFRAHLGRARRERAPLFPDEFVNLLEAWDLMRQAAASNPV